MLYRKLNVRYFEEIRAFKVLFERTTFHMDQPIVKIDSFSCNYPCRNVH